MTHKTNFLTRDELAQLWTPPSTKTHKVIPHVEIVDMANKLMKEMDMQIKRSQFAVTDDGMRMFGTIDIKSALADVDLSLGIRNAHNKTMSLGMVAGYRVMVCSNMAFSGDFSPIFRKHTSGLILRDAMVIGLERVIKLVDPIERQIHRLQGMQLIAAEAKEVILDAFVTTDAPKHLLSQVYNYYFDPVHHYDEKRVIDAFSSATMWSLSNAFTSAFKSLGPISQYQHTASFAVYLNKVLEERMRRYGS